LTRPPRRTKVAAGDNGLSGLKPDPMGILPLPTSGGRSLMSQTKDLLRRAGLHARKGLGQHFLVDGSYLKVILGAAELTPEDVVIEVGPCLGVLTRELGGRAGTVIAVEKDGSLASLLKDALASCPNTEIVNADILEVDPSALISDRAGRKGRASTEYKVVANLPYYITSPVLRHFLEATLKPRSMVVMVQKEVARQITAKPGDMSLVSVGVQLYGDPKIVKYVPARAFYPAPEVDSAILKITVYPTLAVQVETASFFVVVRAGFSAARKQMANSLAHGLDLPKDAILSMLERAHIDPKRRAETLSIGEWGRLWEEYTKMERTDVCETRVAQER